ncbi:MAG: bifunctional isocitrate dehydrogenase kinase/phosphatase [Desulfobacteraceae bacterium]|nr:bifunctional isocitrate dehydrogenase kinase/phosphatase [Desulfobacteraceae bacterium]
MRQHPEHDNMAFQLATYIRSRADAYLNDFRRMTQQAEKIFVDRNWPRMQALTRERIDLYKNLVQGAEIEIRNTYPERIHLVATWESAKGIYGDLIRDRDDGQIAATVFNSLSRRILSTIGHNPAAEFSTETSADNIPEIPPDQCFHYRVDRISADAIKGLLSKYAFLPPDYRPDRDSRSITDCISRHLTTENQKLSGATMEMLKSPFYRGRGAYLVGRIQTCDRMFPLVIAFENTAAGLTADAVLLTEKAVSILFSFTRSYFFVDAFPCTHVIRFLMALLPQKRLAELYIAIGFNKHGKTELFRDLTAQLSSCSGDEFDISAGKKGLVMIAFNMPRDDMVFKVIRDRFGHPKTTTRQQVMDKYNYVFRHDRAGRLLDAQVFEHLKIDRCHFSGNLLGELIQETQKSVKIMADSIILDTCYVERRVTPLDLYLREGSPAQNRAAVIDLGNAIKDLAASNIFPGDMLIKNFGVTRHGRIVFYDYDELCPLTDCRFRQIPQPRNEMEALSDQPWYHVGENDVFPEEFKLFLGLPGHLRHIFTTTHADLFQVAFWQVTQQHIRSGTWIPIYPYESELRLYS